MLWLHCERRLLLLVVKQSTRSFGSKLIPYLNVDFLEHSPKICSTLIKKLVVTVDVCPFIKLLIIVTI